MPVKIMARRLLIFVVTLAAIAGAGFWTFRSVGRWLVVEGPLQRARAIVVLSGLQPHRAVEAAKIFREGWAPEVWLFTDDPRGSEEAFARLGIHYVAEAEYDQQVLERLGVPRSAIRILKPPTTNTASEFQLIGKELRDRHGDNVILVTSPVHTRRARLIWRIIVGNHPQAILRYDKTEPTDPEHWWRATRDVQDVEHEVLGLIDARLGFAVKPRQE